jgi:hypothetical protein
MVPVAKFAASVVDTSGKFAWGKMIHDRTCSKKFLDTVPLTYHSRLRAYHEKVRQQAVSPAFLSSELDCRFDYRRGI